VDGEKVSEETETNLAAECHPEKTQFFDGKLFFLDRCLFMGDPQAVFQACPE